MMSRNKKIAVLWHDIQDIIGPANEWPQYIRKLYWTKGVDHDDRPKIVAFSYINGLNPEVSIL